MLPALIPIISSLAGKALDKFVEDKDLAKKINAEMALEMMKYEGKELDSAMKIIVAEAQSGSWLAQNWRPITMLTFVALIVAHWLGFTPQNMPETQVMALLEIVKVGLGGYVLGRSGEKIAKAWKGEGK